MLVFKNKKSEITNPEIRNQTIVFYIAAMNQLLKILFLLFMFKVGIACGKDIPKVVKPNEFSVLDEYARKTPQQYEVGLTTLASYLIKPAKTDLEKARVLFTWVATHVRYDDAAYNSGNYPDYTAEFVLKNKRAVCEGYSNVLMALCDEAGLECNKIIGYAKGYGYAVGSHFTETDHAWNVIKIDGKWKLFDVTWASGSGTNKGGKLVSTKKFDPFWFDVNPHAFVFTHFPEKPSWQLTGKLVSQIQFERMPWLSNEFFSLGFNADSVYHDAVDLKKTMFVEAFGSAFPIDCSKIPYGKNLTVGEEITFEIKSDYADQIALIDGKTWYYFEKNNNVFTLKHKPMGKKFELVQKINRKDPDFITLVRYRTDKS
jgi:transglutaminase-like putative cysteine protease